MGNWPELLTELLKQQPNEPFRLEWPLEGIVNETENLHGRVGRICYCPAEFPDDEDGVYITASPDFVWPGNIVEEGTPTFEWPLPDKLQMELCRSILYELEAAHIKIDKVESKNSPFIRDSRRKWRPFRDWIWERIGNETTRLLLELDPPSENFRPEQDPPPAVKAGTIKHAAWRGIAEVLFLDIKEEKGKRYTKVQTQIQPEDKSRNHIRI